MDNITFVSSISDNDGHTTSADIKFIQSMDEIPYASLSTSESNYTTADYVQGWETKAQQPETRPESYAEDLRSSNPMKRCVAGALHAHSLFLEHNSPVTLQPGYFSDQIASVLGSGCIRAVIHGSGTS